MHRAGGQGEQISMHVYAPVLMRSVDCLVYALPQPGQLGSDEAKVGIEVGRPRLNLHVRPLLGLAGLNQADTANAVVS